MSPSLPITSPATDHSPCERRPSAGCSLFFGYRRVLMLSQRCCGVCPHHSSCVKLAGVAVGHRDEGAWPGELLFQHPPCWQECREHGGLRGTGLGRFRQLRGQGLASASWGPAGEARSTAGMAWSCATASAGHSPGMAARPCHASPWSAEQEAGRVLGEASPSRPPAMYSRRGGRVCDFHLPEGLSIHGTLPLLGWGSCQELIYCRDGLQRALGDVLKDTGYHN